MGVILVHTKVVEKHIKNTHLYLCILLCQLLLQLTSEGSAFPFMFAKTLSQHITKTLECKAPLMLD